jgi:hypothetical protein
LLSESPPLAPQQQFASLEHAHILNDPKLIVNVWQSNLHEELAKILHIVDDYPYIAMVSAPALQRHVYREAHARGWNEAFRPSFPAGRGWQRAVVAARVRAGTLNGLGPLRMTVPLIACLAAFDFRALIAFCFYVGY